MNLYSEQSEQMTISAIINNPETLYDLESLIDGQDFYFMSHQHLFNGVKYLFGKNAYDIKSLTHLLRERNKLDAVGGVEYIAKLRAQDAKRNTVKLFAEKIKELSIFRKGKAIADRIYESIENESPLDQFTLETNESFNTFDTVRENKMLHIGKVVEQREKEIKSGIKKTSPLTGFKHIDKWMKGIGRDRLIVIAGRPGTGKTAFSLTVSRNISEQDFGVVPVFSMEMSKEELTNRLLSEMTGVPFYVINSEDYQGFQNKAVLEATEELKKLDLFIDDKANMTFDYIVSQCRRMKREHKNLGMVMIDYLGLIRLNRKDGETKTDAIGNMTSGFKNLAKELGCSIVLLCQMNRETDRRANKRPVLSDLRDSGAIEQDADMVIFLHNDPDKTYKEKSHIDFICAKGRQTGIADFELWFNGMIQRFEVKE
jgi:replicative DNA helicase